MMGTGKSTIGLLLANRLKLNYLDSDQWIESLTSLSISEIFNSKGESHFRTLEGIGILKLVLEANGYVEFKVKKNQVGEWTIDVAKELYGKPKFALYTGTETVEEKELIRNIFNNNTKRTISQKISITSFLEHASARRIVIIVWCSDIRPQLDSFG